PASTINRRCSVLRRGFALGTRAVLVGRAPFIPTLDERSPRGRYLAPGDLDAIASHLPARLIPFARVAYALGTRKGQLARTRRDWIDLVRGVVTWPASETKAREAHTVPLDEVCSTLVREVMRDDRPWCPYLFHGPRCRPGVKPSRRYGCLGDFRKAWRTALKRAGLPVGRKSGGFVFHNTRHSAVSNLVAAGLSESDAMKVTGHR